MINNSWLLSPQYCCLCPQFTCAFTQDTSHIGILYFKLPTSRVTGINWTRHSRVLFGPVMSAINAKIAQSSHAITC